MINELDSLFTKTGTLNSALIRRTNFKDSELYSFIEKYSKCLPTDCKMLQRVHHAKYNLTSVPKCNICLNSAHFNPYASKFGEYSSTCKSRSCIAKYSSEKRNNTMIEKYGSKISNNHISKSATAVDNFVSKSKQTIIEKYGVDNISKVPGITARRNKTIKDRYGVDYISQIPDVRQKTIEKSIAFFKTLGNKVNVDSFEGFNNFRKIKFTCLECNGIEKLHTETFKWRSRYLSTPCTVCSGIKNGSAFQKQITDFISSLYDGPVEINNRIVLDGLELDIYLPELNIAIEANGIYWHSCDSNSDREYKNYHVNKTNLCVQKKIRLIHIFEDTWIENNDIVKNRLISLLNPSRIFARKCKIVDISTQQERTFLQTHHVQGYIASSIKKALIYDGKIVAVMTFGKSRFDKKNTDYEMLRFCSVGGTTIVGGASKLLKNILLSFKNGVICSYSDRLWGDGNLYRALGFEFVSISQPSYRWTKNMKSVSRFKTQKHKLPDLLPNFDNTKTEAENMFNDGWRRIWDCGTTKWILKYNHASNK